MKKIFFIIILGLWGGCTYAQEGVVVNMDNVYKCVYQTRSYFWHSTIDDKGNTYMGLYTRGNGTEQCAYIFKRDNKGKISVIYHNNARHIHTVAFNPITKKLYATQGDDLPGFPETQGQSKFIVSADYGITRQTIHHGPRANYIPIIFDNKGCVIVGEDSAQYTPSSRVMKSCDDKHFTTLITLSGDEQANRWSWYQSGSDIYLGTVVDQAGYSPTIWKYSSDNNMREKIVRFGTNTKAWDGFQITGLNKKGVVDYYFGNTQKKISAFAALIGSGNIH